MNSVPGQRVLWNNGEFKAICEIITETGDGKIILRIGKKAGNINDIRYFAYPYFSSSMIFLKNQEAPNEC